MTSSMTSSSSNLSPTSSTPFSAESSPLDSGQLKPSNPALSSPYKSPRDPLSLPPAPPPISAARPAILLAGVQLSAAKFSSIPARKKVPAASFWSPPPSLVMAPLLMPSFLFFRQQDVQHKHVRSPPAPATPPATPPRRARTQSSMSLSPPSLPPRGAPRRPLLESRLPPEQAARRRLSRPCAMPSPSLSLATLPICARMQSTSPSAPFPSTCHPAACHRLPQAQDRRERRARPRPTSRRRCPLRSGDHPACR